MKKLNYFKIKSFIEEFPFLSKIRDLVKYKESDHEYWNFCEEITVRKVTKELLEITPRTIPNGIDEHRVSHMLISELYFIVDFKNNIWEVKPEFDDGMLGEPDTPSEMYGERIIDRISKLMLNDETIKDRIKYIFSIHNGYVPPNIEDSEKYFKITIYKAAKGECIADILEERLNETRNQVKAECNF